MILFFSKEVFIFFAISTAPFVSPCKQIESKSTFITPPSKVFTSFFGPFLLFFLQLDLNLQLLTLQLNGGTKFHLA